MNTIKGLYFAIEAWLEADFLTEEARKFDSSFDAMIPYYHRGNRAKVTVKNIIKIEISKWCEGNGFENSYNRLEVRFIDPWNIYNRTKRTPKIILGHVSIFSSKGSIGSNPKWLNKITIGHENNIVSHVARTDENYLGMEGVEKFRLFVGELKGNISDEVSLAYELKEE